MPVAQIEHIHTTFPHLIDERSFTSWAPHFQQFADAFTGKGIKIPNLIGFIDGKLWPVCKPGKYQAVLYSGHKRIHGLKTQGIVFPNGEHGACLLAQPSPHLHSSLTRVRRGRPIKASGYENHLYIYTNTPKPIGDHEINNFSITSFDSRARDRYSAVSIWPRQRCAS